MKSLQRNPEYLNPDLEWMPIEQRPWVPPFLWLGKKRNTNLSLAREMRGKGNSKRFDYLLDKHNTPIGWVLRLRFRDYYFTVRHLYGQNRIRSTRN